jgi:hypothetical protein
MTLADDTEEERAHRVADRLLTGASHSAQSHHNANLPTTDAQAAADRVADHWLSAAESLVLACFYLVEGLNKFAEMPENLDAFLGRLVEKRVFSENDVLARLKANGKLAMLAKIGRHAETLLEPSLLCLLPAHYSIVYQICLLIEEVGRERAQIELSKTTDTTRDDVLKIRDALKPNATEHAAAPSAMIDNNTAQLFALRPTAQDFRLLVNEYAQVDTLDQCLRRPPPADDAGLVATVPILMLGTFQRALMPLLGFGAPDGLFFESIVDRPEITDRDVIVVAKRGKFRPRPLTAFPADLVHHSFLTLAEVFFPDCTVKCQPFAQARSEGWTTLIGDENWIEKPSVR